MQAFHNDPKIKDKYLSRVQAHRKADELIKGSYWANGKGCAVGCTIHGEDHGKYETELGIPRIIARLEDGIFEGLPNDKAMLWPEQFLEAINPGADLSMVWPKFAVWLLGDPEHGVIKYAKGSAIPAIKKVIEYYEKTIAGETISTADWRAAAAAAAAYAAAYAYAYADAAAAYAADAAADAAYAYAYAADAAAYAAADAAAAYAYAYAAAAAAARKKVREQTRGIQSEKLLELLRECK